MRIAICDDLDEERAAMFALLSEYLAERLPQAELLEFSGGEQLLSAAEQGGFGLVLLDIYMGGISGIETARRLKSLSRDCTLIFITSSAEHGAEAFDVEAFYYLVKPVAREKLQRVLDKWYDTVFELKTIELKCGRMTREVFVSDILYIDVQGRSCTIHTPAEEILTAAPLSALWDELPAGEFIRPIRYSIVSLRHIRAVEQDSLLLTNGQRVPLSRKERARIREQLAAYRLRRLRSR